MYTVNAQSSNRPTEERKSHGVPRQELSYETPPNSHYGNPLKRETTVNFSQAWGSYGSYKAPVPQVISDLQEEPRLGERKIHDSVEFTDEEYINKIKRPLLHINAVPENPQSDFIRQKIIEHEKGHRRRCRTCWLW
jgi:hypothetical protein